MVNWITKRTERPDRRVRKEMMQLLREGTKDPTFTWKRMDPDRDGVETQAGLLLHEAGYFGPESRITLAGMDYYHRQAHPVQTWLKSNWFAVIVAVMTTAATVFAGVSNFLIRSGPC